MKNTPLEEIKHFGCACCARPKKKLPKDTMLDVGFGETVLKIEYPDGQVDKIEYIGGVDWKNFPTVADWEREYGDRFKRAECVTIWFNTPLHDELYELNQEDGEWYLVKQGQGFA